ncbi:TlpA disulfide reductase family protein [Mesonia sp. K7]|uniref:TlpA disulfide reductase family protein n=1 Tax=Mesonia sp. K7 TaxID=2218606 RepID=UPI000DA6E276|nr:TlpA disulfide reductase family protein [Mesonia sp. K7]PZD79253.1 AhpC/TSA family protein [Mesonia sp. K7]
MRKIAFLLVLAAVFACKDDANNANTFTAKIDVEDNTKIFISELGENGTPKPIDTAVVKEGKFTFELPTVENQTLNIATIDQVPGNVLFINENAKIDGTFYKDSLRSSQLDGGKNQELLDDYVSHMMTSGKEQNELNQKMRTAFSQQDTLGMKSLQEEAKSMRAEEITFRKDFISKNSESIVSALILSDMISMQLTENFSELYNKLSPEVQNSAPGKKIKEHLSLNQSTAIGSKAPSFSAKTPEGKELALENALGKVTIIDFWASWCKPCRIENPNVVRLYNKYHDKGLNILGVSLDKANQKDRWIQAIEDDKLTWQHVSNLQFWNDPIAKLYNVRSIPATFILDENGVIIAKNLRGKALEDKIAELLD